jgi:hypothetical protein
MCSDISVARRDVLLDPHFSDEPVIVGHMGGETTLLEASTLEFGRSDGLDAITLVGVFIVEPEMLPAGIVALLGVGDIQKLGMSLDAIMASPDCFWEQAIPLSMVGRLRRAVRQCFGWGRSAPRQAPSLPPHPAPAPGGRPAERPSLRREPRTPPREQDEGIVLLEGVKRQLSEEQRKRTANRVAQLFQEGIARKQALQAQRSAHMQGSMPVKREFSGEPLRVDLRTQFSSETSKWPRKRPNFYAVHRGRNICIFHSLEECERQTKGIYSEFKIFSTLEEAQAYLTERRLNFMAVRRAKPALLGYIYTVIMVFNPI